MSTIFDGKSYAEKKKYILQSGSDRARESGVIPHLATIVIGDNPASILYTNLKKKFIESLGCQVDIYNLLENTNIKDIELLIKTLNEDETVHGIMVQLPLPEAISNKATSSAVKFKILNLIAKNKDIDGLRDDSDYLHPTSKAVMEVLAMAIYETKIDVMTVCVVGSGGMVGKPLVKEFKKLGYIVLEADKDTDNLKSLTLQADAVISATGSMNLISPDMVNDETIVIDVGSPYGDVQKEIVEKASFYTPVPGGVGPVTITCLAENLILAATSTITSTEDVNSQES
jgi:methylenetetrahydrofolate dehydrogenase (NADP+)/methenyltetrahydrofolate cyclohydrolase